MRDFRNTSLNRVWLAAAGVVLMHGAALAADFSVCIDSSSPSAARDETVARAVAKLDGDTLAVHRFDGAADDDGVSTKKFKSMLSTQCQLVLGYPIDMTNGEPPGDLFASAPYDQTGFVLVVAGGENAKSLADFPAGTDIAVTFETAPNLYFAAHPNVQADIHETDKETLESLAAGHVKAAMVWQATVEDYQRAHPKAAGFKVYPLAEPHARWNVVALYAPSGAAAAVRFDAAMKALNEAASQPRKHAGLAAESPIRLVADVGAIPTTGSASPEALKKSATTAPPALYTEAQAAAGKQKFADNCEQCHGTNLEGLAGPALKGKNFASVKSAFTVGDVFTIVSQNMPATQPGSLEHDDYVQIMAFLLQQNGYPAGKTALAFDSAQKSGVPLLYHGQ